MTFNFWRPCPNPVHGITVVVPGERVTLVSGSPETARWLNVDRQEQTHDDSGRKVAA